MMATRWWVREAGQSKMLVPMVMMAMDEEESITGAAGIMAPERQLFHHLTNSMLHQTNKIYNKNLIKSTEFFQTKLSESGNGRDEPVLCGHHLE